ncbi:MAG: AI-2E family transporter [bacterium]|nr:AI-2E family transporter [bacterium]
MDNRAGKVSRPRMAGWIGFALVLCLGLVVGGRILVPFFSVIVLSLVTVGLLYQPYSELVKRMRGHRRSAALVVCVILMMAVVAPLILTMSEVSQEALSFYEMTTVQLAERDLLEGLEEQSEWLEKTNRYLSPFGFQLTAQEIYDQLASVGVQLGTFFYRGGVSIAKGAVRVIFGFFFWILIVFYLLVDGERFRRWIETVAPLPQSEQRHVLARLSEMSGSLVIGNGFAGIIQGVVGGLMFAVLGLPGPVLWGVVMGILAFVPVIGVSLVYIPASVILLIMGESGRALTLFIPLAIISALVEYWLKPMLVGRRAHMHTLLVFLSLLGGLDAFGPAGLIIGPLLMTAVITLIEIYRDSYRPQLLGRRGTVKGEEVKSEEKRVKASN